MKETDAESLPSVMEGKLRDADFLDCGPDTGKLEYWSNKL